MKKTINLIDELVIIPKSSRRVVQEITVDFAREDLNALRDKVNEIIRSI